MSDGPHKSLPMPTAWKQFAERICNEAFSEEEVLSALASALINDGNADKLPNAIESISDLLASNEGALFKNDLAQSIDDERVKYAGYPMAMLFLDHAKHEFTQAQSNSDAVENAVEASLRERAVRGNRQVEEHYARETSNYDPVHLRSRLESSYSRTDFHELSSNFLSPAGDGGKRSTLKSDGIDDGVLL